VSSSLPAQKPPRSPLTQSQITRRQAVRYMAMPITDFEGVLSIPRREQTQGGQLFRFRFDNGYGALVMQNAQQPAESAFEVCLLDCTREPARPTFEHLICPEVMFGYSQMQVSVLLIQAERLPRHPRLTHSDEELLGEDF
jgi:hypothetical protein